MKRILPIILVLVANLAFAQVDLNLGLKAYYPFNGNANDASGNGNNAIFNNATLTDDHVGNPNSAYHFNGSNTYIQVPDNATLHVGNQMSMCAWVRPTGFYMGPCHGNSIIEKGGVFLCRFDDGLYTNWNNCINTTVDVAHEEFYGPLSASVPSYTPYIQTGQWYSVVVTYDAVTLKVYVNCELKISLPSPGFDFTTTSDLYFGQLNSFPFPYSLNGDLDEIRIYNRAINEDEIALYGNCTAAPVTLTSFNTSVIDNKAIKLTWNTEAESQIKNYSVERSVTGSATDFISIGTVTSNNNSYLNSYAFTDNTARPNTLYYYRLAINDNMGSRKFSTTKTAKIINNDFYSLMYPNPTQGLIKVFINNAAAGAQINIIDDLGRIISTKQMDNTFSNPVLIDVSNFSKGVYWISIQSGENKSIEKIIKQ